MHLLVLLLTVHYSTLLFSTDSQQVFVNLATVTCCCHRCAFLAPWSSPLQVLERQLDGLQAEVSFLRGALSKEQGLHQDALDEVVKWKEEHHQVVKELDNTTKKVRCIYG